VPVFSSLKGADRKQQVKKIMDYVYMVKVNWYLTLAPHQ
jgi:hypothetical protein